MTKLAAVLVVLVGIALVGLVDRDGRIVAGDLAARVLGYVVRVELTVERPTRVPPPIRPVERGVGSGSEPDRCALPADSVTRVVVWR